MQGSSMSPFDDTSSRNFCSIVATATAATIVTVTPVVIVEAVPPAGATALILLCAITGTLGVLSNTLAIVVIFVYTTIWKKARFFLLVNQIAVDLVACLFASAQYYSILNGDLTVAVFGIKFTDDSLCRWWYSKAFMWTFINSSSCNVVMVTLERYVKVFYPLGHRSHFTKKLAGCVLTVVWLFGPVTQLVPILLTSGVTKVNRCVKSQLWSSVREQTAYNITILFLQYFIPLAIMAFVYARLFVFIRARYRRVTPSATSLPEPRSTAAVMKTTALSSAANQNSSTQSSKSSTANQNQLPREQQVQATTAAATISMGSNERNKVIEMNVLKTAILVGVAFLLLWSWVTFYFLLVGLAVMTASPIFAILSAVSVVASCALNPVIYTTNLRHFQVGLRTLYSRLTSCH